MESTQISINFRGQRINGLVHKHNTHYLVWFSDSGILKDFGGMIEVSSDFKATGKKTEAPDVQHFHEAIIRELQKLS
jgi:hypothetical protein